MHKLTGLILLFAIVLFCDVALSDSFSFCKFAAAQREEEYLLRLSRFSIEPNFSSIKKYFDDLKPSEIKRSRVRKLIGQLASDEFHVRKTAMQQLVAVPALPRSEIVSARSSNDADFNWRLEQILRTTDKQKEHVFRAVLQAIEKHKIAGLFGSLLDSLEDFDVSKCESQLHRSLATTFFPGNLARTQAGLKSSSLTVRMLSIYVLVHRAPESIDPTFTEFLNQQTDSVQLFAAKQLANVGHRSALKFLVQLLNSDNLEIRARSISILRRLTKMNFGYIVYAKPEERKASHALWQKWIKTGGTTAKLHFPLKGLEIPFTGKLLVCNYSQNFVFAMNEKGEVLWKKDNIGQPWGVQVLPNGNFLVAACTGRKVYEFTPEGKEVWKVEELQGNPLSVQRLENGNTLVATGSAGKVFEYAPDKKAVKVLDIGGFVADAQRLENGRTLIAQYRAGAIAEVDSEGKIVWKLDGYVRPRSARRLANGNTLIAENGNQRGVEVDREGKVVLEIRGVFAPYDAYRLEDGRTVVTGSKSLSMYDAKGKLEWSQDKLYNSRVFPF